MRKIESDMLSCVYNPRAANLGNTKVRVHETVRTNNMLKGIILNPRVSDAVRAEALAELTPRLQPAEAFLWECVAASDISAS